MSWYKLIRTFYWVNLSSIFVDQGLEASVTCYQIVVYYQPPSFTSITSRPPTSHPTLHYIGCCHRLLLYTRYWLGIIYIIHQGIFFRYFLYVQQHCSLCWPRTEDEEVEKGYRSTRGKSTEQKIFWNGIWFHDNLETRKVVIKKTPHP